MAARTNNEIQLCQTKYGPIPVAVHSCYNPHLIETRSDLNNVWSSFDVDFILALLTLNNCSHLG